MFNIFDMLETETQVAKDIADYNLRTEDDMVAFMWDFGLDNQRSTILRLCKDRQQEHNISKREFVLDVKENGIQAFERLMCQFINGRARNGLTEVDSGDFYDFWKHENKSTAMHTYNKYCNWDGVFHIKRKVSRSERYANLI